MVVFFPRSLKNDLKRKNSLRELRVNYMEDMKKYIKYSFEFTKKKTKRHYEADLIFYYHKIEKGLSLPNSRVGFGQNNVEHLLKLLENYVKNFGWDKTSLISLDVLYQYYYFNEQNNCKLDELLKRLNILEETLKGRERLFLGGMTRVTKKEIDEKRAVNFKDFAYSRYSVRDFAPGDVGMSTLN